MYCCLISVYTVQSTNDVVKWWMSTTKPARQTAKVARSITSSRKLPTKPSRCRLIDVRQFARFIMSIVLFFALKAWVRGVLPPIFNRSEKDWKMVGLVDSWPGSHGSWLFSNSHDSWNLTPIELQESDSWKKMRKREREEEKRKKEMMSFCCRQVAEDDFPFLFSSFLFAHTQKEYFIPP